MGGASGLGRETAILLANNRSYVTIADIQSREQTVEELKSNGHNAQYVQCDVTSWDSQVKAFQSALAFSQNKTLDIVAIFAGIDSQGHLIDHATSISSSIDGLNPRIREIQVNLIGALYTATLGLHYSKLGSQETRKSLIIVSCLAGYLDDTHNSIYTTSKFGLRGLFRAIRA